MKKLSIAPVKQFALKAVNKVKVNSPILLTVAGAVGIGATAYLSYKAAKNIESIMDKKDDMDCLDTPMTKQQLIFELSSAVALPVAVGAASVCAFGLSYYIMNNRILNLSAALTTVMAESKYYRAKYVEKHGQDAANEFYTPVHEETQTITNADGDEEEKIVSVTDTADSLWGAWYEESSEFMADDHNYNIAWIQTQEEALSNKLFRNGYLVLNDVRDALGLERTRAAAVVGYTPVTTFELNTKVTMMEDPITGESEPHIWISWPEPENIVDSIAYSGRYSD